jgi:hypothetical protein
VLLGPPLLTLNRHKKRILVRCTLGRTGRHTADKADYRHGRLLRARRERPRGSGSAEQSDELAPLP